MKEKIIELYESFFENMSINPKTGSLNKTLKFETYPYIGSKFETSDLRIMFVGLDIGKEELKNEIQSLDYRRSQIEADFKFNPHIAGTYTSALFLLKDNYKWDSSWENIIKYSTSSQATKIKQHKDNENPLSFIALSNFFKFVDKERINRSGDKNRKFINQELETKLFINEVKILCPNIIVIQGNTTPSIQIVNEFKGLNIKILKAPHPSNRKKGGRHPLNYVNDFIEL